MNALRQQEKRLKELRVEAQKLVEEVLNTNPALAEGVKNGCVRQSIALRAIRHLFNKKVPTTRDFLLFDIIEEKCPRSCNQGVF